MLRTARSLRHRPTHRPRPALLVPWQPRLEALESRDAPSVVTIEAKPTLPAPAPAVVTRITTTITVDARAALITIAAPPPLPTAPILTLLPTGAPLPSRPASLGAPPLVDGSRASSFGIAGIVPPLGSDIHLTKGSTADSGGVVPATGSPHEPARINPASWSLPPNLHWQAPHAPDVFEQPLPLPALEPGAWVPELMPLDAVAQADPPEPTSAAAAPIAALVVGTLVLRRGQTRMAPCLVRWTRFRAKLKLLRKPGKAA